MQNKAQPQERSSNDTDIKRRRSTTAMLMDTAGGKGTGGTDLMQFLKPLRQDTTLAIVE